MIILKNEKTKDSRLQTVPSIEKIVHSQFFWTDSTGMRPMLRINTAFEV